MVSDKTAAQQEGKAKRLESMRVDGITPKQERAILALLSEPTIPKAAKACGCGERTIHRWLGEGAFSAAYRNARRQAFGQAIGLAQQYAPLAMHTLIKAMAEDSPAHVKVSAATALLKFAREGIELDDLAARVEALEQSVSKDSPIKPAARWSYFANSSN